MRGAKFVQHERHRAFGLDQIAFVFLVGGVDQRHQPFKVDGARRRAGGLRQLFGQKLVHRANNYRPTS